MKGIAITYLVFILFVNKSDKIFDRLSKCPFGESYSSIKENPPLTLINDFKLDTAVQFGELDKELPNFKTTLVKSISFPINVDSIQNDYSNITFLFENELLYNITLSLNKIDSTRYSTLYDRLINEVNQKKPKPLGGFFGYYDRDSKEEGYKGECFKLKDIMITVYRWTTKYGESDSLSGQIIWRKDYNIEIQIGNTKFSKQSCPTKCI
jgi:hypothetical protein